MTALNDTIAALAPVLVPLLSSLAGAAGTAAVSYFQKSKRLSNLSAVAQAAQDALTAALAAAGADIGKPTPKILSDAAAAAKAKLLNDLPNIEKSLEAELDTLINGFLITRSGIVKGKN